MVSLATDELPTASKRSTLSPASPSLLVPGTGGAPAGGVLSGESVHFSLEGGWTIVPGFGRCGGCCCWVAVCASKAVLAASMTAREVGSSRFIRRWLKKP